MSITRTGFVQVEDGINSEPTSITSTGGEITTWTTITNDTNNTTAITIEPNTYITTDSTLTVSEGESVYFDTSGTTSIRRDITVLPSDSGTSQIGWRIYETEEITIINNLWQRAFIRTDELINIKKKSKKTFKKYFKQY